MNGFKMFLMSEHTNIIHDSIWKQAVRNQKVKLELSYSSIARAIGTSPGVISRWLTEIANPTPRRSFYTKEVNKKLAKVLQLDATHLQNLFDTAVNITPDLLQWQRLHKAQRVNLGISMGSIAKEVNALAGTTYTPTDIKEILNDPLKAPFTRRITDAFAITLSLPKEKSWKLYKSKEIASWDKHDKPLSNVNFSPAPQISDKPSHWQKFVLRQMKVKGISYRELEARIKAKVPTTSINHTTLFNWLHNKKSPRPLLTNYPPEINAALAFGIRIPAATLADAYTNCETPLAPKNNVMIPLEVLADAFQGLDNDVSKDVALKAVEDMIKTVEILNQESEPITTHNITHYWKVLNT